MAFKKTQGPSVSVSPVGLPDLSGFGAAAKMYTQLSNDAMSVGTDIRRREFNSAIRQAEKDGRTSGVRRDKDGNLVPLVNFDYAKASDMFSSSEREAVLNSYKKAAVGAYAASAVVGISQIANTALTQNPDDPEAIDSAFSGYMQKLSSLDEDIYVQLAPKAEAIFMEARNKALATQQDNTQRQSRSDLSQHFMLNQRELGNLVAVGPGSNDEDAFFHNERLQEIMDEQNVILENLAVFETPAEEIQALKNQQTNFLAMRAGQGHIERVFAASGNSHFASLESIEEIVANTPEDVDAEKLRSVLQAHANDLNAKHKAQEEQRNKEQTSVYQSVMGEVNKNLAGIPGAMSVSEMLLDPDNKIHILDETQIGSLLSQDDSSRQKYINDRLAEPLAYLANWESIQGTQYEEGLFKRFETIKSLHRDFPNEVGFERFNKARTDFMAYQDHIFIKPQRDRMSAFVQTELSANGTYIRDMDWWLAKQSELEASGVIGPDGAFKSASAYVTKVNEYGVRRKKVLAERAVSDTALRKARSGINLNSTELDAILSTQANYNPVMLNGQVTGFDFISENQDVVQASIDAADRFAGDTGGVLIPEVMNIIESAPNNVEVADLMNRVVGQVVTGLASKNGITTDEAMSIVLDRNNIVDEDLRSFIAIGAKLGPEVAVEAYKGFDGLDMNRSIARVIGNRTSGDDLATSADDFFEQAMDDAMTSRNWWAFFNPLISDERQTQLNEFADSIGGMSPTRLKDAIFLNPDVEKAMKGLFFQRMARQKNAGHGGMVMLDVMRTLGTRFGYQENKATGELFIVDKPIQMQAMGSVPTMSTPSGEVVPTYFPTQEMIVSDFIHAYTAFVPEGTLQDPKLVEAVKKASPTYDGLDKTDITFHANMNFGGDQTYTVLLKDRLGNVSQVLSNSYRWTHASSVQAEHYAKIEQNLKTSKIKNFFAGYGLFDRSIIQNSMERYAKTQSDASFDGIIRTFDEIRLLTSPGATPEYRASLGQPFTAEEIKDFQFLMETLTSLGYY